MNFGKNILQKYGWKEGEGIGKNSDGIAKPIKASLKFDNAGFGHDRGEEFTNHWWQKAFNNAAKNIDVNTDEAAVSMSLKNGESVEITTRDYSVSELKKNRGKKASNGYGSFVMSSVLLNKDGCDDVKSDIDSDDQTISSKSTIFNNVLSDEALFAACGGRTAHKGARHGLSLGGKLSRIEEQERQLLEKHSNSFNSATATDVFKEWAKVDLKKKKKKKLAEVPPTPIVEGISDPLDPLKLSGLVNQDDYTRRRKNKKGRKRHRVLDEDLASTLLSSLNTSAIETEKFSGKGEWRGVQSSSTTIEKKKSSKKKKRRPSIVDNALDQDIVLDETAEPKESDKFLKKSKLLARGPVPGPSTERTAEIKVKNASKVDKKTKKRKRIEVAPDLSDNDSDIELQHGNLALQIENEIKKRPNKRIKVVVENMTKFQSRHLAKAGIEFVERKENHPAKLKQELIEFDRIAQKMRNSLSLDEDQEP